MGKRLSRSHSALVPALARKLEKAKRGQELSTTVLMQTQAAFPVNGCCAFFGSLKMWKRRRRRVTQLSHGGVRTDSTEPFGRGLVNNTNNMHFQGTCLQGTQKENL